MEALKNDRVQVSLIENNEKVKCDCHPSEFEFFELIGIFSLKEAGKSFMIQCAGCRSVYTLPFYLYETTKIE